VGRRSPPPLFGLKLRRTFPFCCSMRDEGFLRHPLRLAGTGGGKKGAGLGARRSLYLVMIQPFSLLVVLGALAIGLLTAKFSSRFEQVEWAQRE